MSALLTLTDVKTALQMPAAQTYYDAAINAIIDAIDQITLSEVSMTALTQTTHSQYVRVEWESPMLRLPHWPVISGSVSAVTNDGSAVDSDDYAVHESEGYLELIDSTKNWKVGPKKVEVTWQSGFANVADLKQAEIHWACDMFNRTPKEGLRTQTIGTYRMTLLNEPIPPAVARILSRARNPFE